MKSMIFWALGILMFFNLDAFAKPFEEDAFSISYVNNRVDMAPVVLLDVQPMNLSDMAFKIAISSSMLELEEQTQTNNSLISRVVVSLCCRF